jgi:hypothetical protein
MRGAGPVPASTAPNAARWWESALTAARWSTPLVALALGLTALSRIAPEGIGSLGLVDVLPAGLYVALALLTAGFLAAVIFARSVNNRLLAVHVVVFALLLHGAAAVIEPLPRFVPAWLHVGFTDYVARTGEILPELDARFSWPGFFALAAMATRAAGLPDAMPLLDWTPVVLNLLFGAVVYRLARATDMDPRGAWLAVWLFFPTNWVGQDYFAPQGLNYLFYLLILAILVIWFRVSRMERARRRARRSPRLRVRRLLRLVGLPAAPMLHEPEPVAASGATLAGLMAVLLVIFTASTASHQLTPTAILVSVAALVVVRRSAVRALPVLLAVVLVGYISYLTVAYWSGHLHEMLGSLGLIGRTVDKGVRERVQGDPGHLIVLQVRQLFTVAVWALAAAGAWRSMRRGHGDLAFLVLAGAPFLLLFLQSYGGEVFLRIYTFALPFMVVLVVALVVPVWPARRVMVAAALAGLLSISFTGAFFLTRYGNESFEQVRPADLRAVGWLYDNATPGVSFVALTSDVPWRYRDLEQYRHVPLGQDLGPDSVTAIEAAMEANPRGAYLIMTEGQYVFGEAFLGKPHGWGPLIERQIIESGRFRLVYERDGAKIFVLATTRGRN